MFLQQLSSSLDFSASNWLAAYSVGHWSKHWEEELYASYTCPITRSSIHLDSYYIRNQFEDDDSVILLEQQNGDMQGKSESEQRQRLVEQQKLLILDLFSRKDKFLPKDQLYSQTNCKSEYSIGSTRARKTDPLILKPAALKSTQLDKKQDLTNTLPLQTISSTAIIQEEHFFVTIDCCFTLKI